MKRITDLTMEEIESIYWQRQAGFNIKATAKDYGLSVAQVRKVHRLYQQYKDDQKNLQKLYRFNIDRGEMEIYTCYKHIFKERSKVVYFMEDTYAQRFPLIRVELSKYSWIHGYKTKKDALKEAKVLLEDRMMKDELTMETIKQQLSKYK